MKLKPCNQLPAYFIITIVRGMILKKTEKKIHRKIDGVEREKERERESYAQRKKIQGD